MSRRKSQKSFSVEELDFHYQVPFTKHLFVDLLNLAKETWTKNQKNLSEHEKLLLNLLAQLETAIAIRYKLLNDKNSNAVPPLYITNQEFFSKKWGGFLQGEQEQLTNIYKPASDTVPSEQADADSGTSADAANDDDPGTSGDTEEDAAEQARLLEEITARRRGLAEKLWQTNIANLCPSFYSVYSLARAIAQASGWRSSNFSKQIKTLMTTHYTEDDLARAYSDIEETTLNVQGSNLQQYELAVGVYRDAKEQADEATRKAEAAAADAKTAAADARQTMLDITQQFAQERTQWQQERTAMLTIMQERSRSYANASTAPQQNGLDGLSPQAQRQVTACTKILKKNIGEPRSHCIETIVDLLNRGASDCSLEELLEKLLHPNRVTEEQDNTVADWLTEHSITETAVTTALEPYKTLPLFKMNGDTSRHYQVVSILYKYGGYFRQDIAKSARFNEYRTNPPCQVEATATTQTASTFGR